MRARRRGAGERFASAALSGLDSVSRRRHDGVPEHVVFEKGGTRGGSAASPGLKRAEKRVFLRNNGPYGLERAAFQTEIALFDIKEALP